MSSDEATQGDRIRILERQVEILTAHLRTAGDTIDGLRREVRDLEALHDRTLRSWLGRSVRRLLGLPQHQRQEFPLATRELPPQVD
jgi:hypothetical protein